MYDKQFWFYFSKRSLICFIVIIALLFSCILRTAKIATSNYSEVQKNFSSLKIKIGNTRGTIFDCNKYPLTNNQKKIIACISPTPRAITAISQILSDEALKTVLEQLKNGKPVTCQVPEKINCDGIVCTEIYTTSPTIPAIHTIGYTDTDNKGVIGIQKAYDSILYNSEDITVRFACDGKGRILSGVKPEILGETSPYNNAVVTTIDINIQNIAEREAKNLSTGSVIIADAKTAKIRAITSVPTFNTDDISQLLSEETTPLFNRSLAAYNVGSVFKPCVAAAGIENGYSSFGYTCTGSFEIIDRIFKCHEHLGHGNMDLNNAIAKSCNTYFYNFGIKVGKSELLNISSNLNFGKSIKLGEGVFTAKGNLPKEEKLENIAHLANFSIGQGDFTASPVSLLPLYCAIANDGQYYLPSIVESTIKNGKEEKYNIGSPTKVFKSNTAQKLKNALSLVISEGTGALAKPKNVTAAGKTATAQTGKFRNGVEINSSWFCGFLPIENPQYVIIIFCEDTKKQTKSCAEIFSNIADSLYQGNEPQIAN